jgi:hypothetical protein
MFYRFCKQLLDAGAVTDIASKKDDIAVELIGFHLSLVNIDIGHHQPDALGEETLADRKPYTIGSTGNYGYLVF